MSIIKAILPTLVGITAPIYMILLLPFIEKESEPSTMDGENDNSNIVRGHLPGWANFAETPDMPFPGGMYEPQSRGIYEKFGFYAASYEWAGLRNRAQGMAYNFGEDADAYIPDPFSFVEGQPKWEQNGRTYIFKRESDGMHQKWFRLWGSRYLVTGFDVHRMRGSKFRGYHYISLKKHEG